MQPVATNKEVKLLITAQDQASAALKNVGGGLDGLKDAAGSLLSVLGPLAGAIGVKEIIDTAITWQGYTNALTAVTGSAKKASEELGFVRKISNELGLDLEKTTADWVMFAAATKGSALEGVEAKRIFETFSGTFQVLGVGADRAHLGLLALQQMISKGKVSSEELRQQLGEQLPGAFRIFAQALGVTESVLGGMLKDGEVLAAETLPKVANKLMELYGPGFQLASESALASMNRFNTSVADLKLQLADAGVIDTYVAAITSLTTALKDEDVAKSIKNIGEAFKGIENQDTLLNALKVLIKTFEILALGVNASVIALTYFAEEKISKKWAALALLISGDVAGAIKTLADTSPIEKLGDSFERMAPAATDFWEATVDGASMLAPVAEQAGDAMTEMWKKAHPDGNAALSIDELKAKIALLRDQLTSPERKTNGNLLKEYMTTVAELDKAMSGSLTVAQKTGKGVKDTANEAAKDAAKMALELKKVSVDLEKIASNERIKKLELSIKFDTEKLKAEAEIAQEIIKTLDTTIKSTGDLLGSLFDNLTDAFNRPGFGLQSAILDQIEAENKRRDTALEMQKKLTEAQIEAIRAKTEALNSGNALVTMTLDGVEPELETIMWKIVDRLQARVNEEAAALLLGIA